MFPAAICCTFGMFFFGYTMEHGLAAELCAFLQGVMTVSYTHLTLPTIRLV